MKGKLLIFILFLGLPWLSKAQDSLLTVSTTVVEERFEVDLSDLDLRLELKVDVSNFTEDTLELKWERWVIATQENWETQSCDNQRCYLPFVSTNYDVDAGITEPYVLPPDSTHTYILYLLPNGQEGNGHFQIDFSLITNPDSILTTIDLRAEVSSLVTSTLSLREIEDVYLFPNPATNFFRIANDSKVEQVIVRNILGREVRAFQAYSGASYNIFDLPQGIYLVSLIDRSDQIIKTMRMSKHRFRP